VVKGSVSLTKEQAVQIDVPVAVAGIDTSADAYKVVLIPYADVKAGTYTEADFDTPDTGLVATKSYNAGALAAGDWIVIGVDEACAGTYAAAEKFYIIPITVAGVILGDSTVNDVIVDVSLPMDLNFAIDPLDLDDKAGQVTQANYYAVNKTGVPVIVDVDVTAAPKAGVTLVSDPTTLDKAYPAVGATVAKNAYFGVLGATSVARGVLNYSNIPGAAAVTYTKDTAGTLNVFNPQSKKASLRFALAAATGNDDKTATQSILATDDKGVASYTLYAELNTYADWTAGDLSVAGVYTLVPVLVADVPAPEDIVGLNVVKTGPSEPGWAQTGASASAPLNGGIFTVDKSDAQTAGGYTIPFNFVGETPSNVQWNGSTAPTDNSAYTFSAGTLKIVYSKFSSLTAGTTRAVAFTVDSKTFTCTLSFVD
jgi:hypothetical protein